MKKITFILCFFVLSISTIMAQTTTPATTETTLKLEDPSKKKPKPKKQDNIILNFNWNGMLNAPQTATVNPLSRGFDFALMWDIPLGRSPFSFAAGLGMNFENIYFNEFFRKNSGDSIYFEPIKPVINTGSPTTERTNKVYKLATTIIELPIEFRFRLNPAKRNTFKLAAGFKLGYVVSNWEKYVGPDYRPGGNLDKEIHITEHELSGISRLRYAAFFRIGYSRIHLSGSYQIAPFFEPNKGVNTGNIVTLGLCFTPF